MIGANSSPASDDRGPTGAPSFGTRLLPQLLPWWLRTVPLFLSALFFLSAFFALLSPLPLVYANLRFGRWWAWAAAITNTIWVAVAAGPTSAGVYVAAVLTVGLVLPELMRQKVSLQRTWAWTLGALSLASLIAVVIVAKIHGVAPAVEIRSQLTQLVEIVSQSFPAANQDGMDPATFKEELLREVPSVVGVFALMLVWANIAVAARFRTAPRTDEGGVNLPSIRAWKAPEWLVWPTIAAGFLLIFDAGPASVVALNVFKFMMALYAIQGLCVMSFFMEAWNLRGGLRLGILVATVLLMLPLVLSLGFFDLWFDFRSKFRQS